MFKSFFKAFILIIGIMFANMSFADTTSDVFSSSSCSGLKDTFLEIAKDKTTDNLQFSYKEALKCNIEVLPKSIIVKLFYMVFGDFSLDTMDIAVSIIQPILGLNIDFKDEAKAGMNGITVIDMFSTIITAITKVIGMAAALLVGSFYVMYLVSSAQDGEVLGKA